MPVYQKTCYSVTYVPLLYTAESCQDIYLASSSILGRTRSHSSSLKMKTASSIPTVPSKDSVKAELSRYFGIHGRFCASHPWEVIVSTVTLTVCVLSMSVLSGGKVGAVCGINKPCQKKSPEEEVCSFPPSLPPTSLPPSHLVFMFPYSSRHRKLTHFSSSL